MAQKRDSMPRTPTSLTPFTTQADMTPLSSTPVVSDKAGRDIVQIADKTTTDLAVERAVSAKAHVAHQLLTDLGQGMMTRAAQYYESSAATLNQPRDDNAQHYVQEI